MIFEGDLAVPPFGKRKPERPDLNWELFNGSNPPTDEEVKLYRGFKEYEEFQRSNGNGR